MRNRREAADRLPPLPSGHRDPLDDARVTLRWLHCYPSNGRYSLIRGHLRPVIAGTHIRATWSPSDHGFLVRSEYVDDVTILAERLIGYRVVVHTTAVAS